MSTLHTRAPAAADTGKPVCIVLARAEMTGLRETDRFERRDGNWYPVFAPCLRPVALVWLNEGSPVDLSNAKRYATSEGYRVFTFPTSESDPLKLAKAFVMKGDN